MRLWCRTGRGLIGALLAVALAGCSAGGPAVPTRGGKAGLPGPVPAGASFAPAVPERPGAPDFTLTLLDGTQVTVSTLWRDRPVVLVFFSSWCGPCGDRQRAFNDLAGKYRDLVAFVGIAGRDTAPEVHRYLDQHQVPYPVGLDDAQQAAGRSYALAEPPLIAVVSKGGSLVRGFPGGAAAEAVDAELAKLASRP